MPNIIPKLFVALFVASLFAFEPSLVMAGPYETSFEEMDNNGDTHVDHDEFIAGYEGVNTEETFKKIDKNKSNTVSMDEWMEYKKSEDEKDFKDMDKNTDRQVDEKEFSEKYSKHRNEYKDIDTDMSGTLSQDEWTEYKKEHDLGDDRQ